MDNFQLHQLQNIETDILSQIDSFCTKFDLKYSLYAGTAIGAVRHHGFIPWDDDVDICMKRRDFEKFQDIWKNNSIPGLFMQGTHIEDQSHYTHIKIFKDGTLYCTAEEYKEPIHHGVWIDIFALDNVPKNKLKRIVQKIWAIIRMALTKDKVIHNRGIAIKLFSAFFVSLPKNLKLKLRRKSDIEVTKYADCSDGYALKSFNSILGI